MTTNETLKPKVIFINIVLGLVVCSYVVSYSIVDLLYLLILLGLYKL